MLDFSPKWVSTLSSGQDRMKLIDSKDSTRKNSNGCGGLTTTLLDQRSIFSLNYFTDLKPIMLLLKLNLMMTPGRMMNPHQSSMLIRRPKTL
jgi:hypothetical protein